MRKCVVVSGYDVETSDVTLSTLPTINGLPNEQVSSGFLYEQKASGVAIRTSELGPNGYLAAHKAAGTACIQVISGSGVTVLTDEAGSVIREIELKAGDLVVFEENMSLHYYRAGAEGMGYIAVSIPANS